ncbi:MAG: hypothetical protein F9B45_14820 [Phycisphaera sp. RhM]|nr:hypothetical protein [Phycisphaera sp. RhM]
MPELLVLTVMGSLLSVLVVFPLWLICKKAGFPGWISLAVFFPVLNLILLFYLAFAPWPALNKPKL